MQTLFVSDIDNTLTGDEKALQELGTLLKTQRESQEMLFILCTGRSLSAVLEGCQTEGLPEADVLICHVGTEIYLPPFHVGMQPLVGWQNWLRSQFSYRLAEYLVEDLEGWIPQPSSNQTEIKLSGYVEGPSAEATVAEIHRRAKEATEDYLIVWSHQKYLDILPAEAGKGKAIQYVKQHLGLTPTQVIVAGDSGNDNSMFEHGFQGIVVANAQPELKEWVAQLVDQPIYITQQPAAAGVQEGLRYFGGLP